jgi:hypothetical protein
LLPDSVVEPATPLAAPAGGEPAAAVGANTFSWDGFTITKRLPGVHHVAGWYASCPYHEKERSGCNIGELYCSREVTVGRGYGAGLNEEETLRLLKEWCVTGPMPDQPRKEHMKHMRLRVQPRDLKANQRLDELRRFGGPLGA